MNGNCENRYHKCILRNNKLRDTSFFFVTEYSVIKKFWSIRFGQLTSCVWVLWKKKNILGDHSSWVMITLSEEKFHTNSYFYCRKVIAGIFTTKCPRKLGNESTPYWIQFQTRDWRKIYVRRSKVCSHMVTTFFAKTMQLNFNFSLDWSGLSRVREKSGETKFSSPKMSGNFGHLTVSVSKNIITQ